MKNIILKIGHYLKTNNKHASHKLTDDVFTWAIFKKVFKLY